MWAVRRHLAVNNIWSSHAALKNYFVEDIIACKKNSYELLVDSLTRGLIYILETNKEHEKYLHNTLGKMNKRVCALPCKQGYVFV